MRGYQAMDRKLKSISTKLDCDIYDIAIPHKKSVRLLMDNGYEAFLKSIFENIKPSFGSDNVKENIYGFLGDYRKYLKVIKHYKLSELSLTELKERDLTELNKISSLASSMVGDLDFI